MLQRLSIQNIAIIDNLTIDFTNGLNILTGETGAGKSIIIDSLNAILGCRTSKELIRAGAEKAFLEAVFEVDNSRFSALFDEYGIEAQEDGSLILQREVTPAGKNFCRINGRLSTVSTLKCFGELLVDVHGQHDNQSLLNVESHIDLTDCFAAENFKETKSEFQNSLNKYREIRHRLIELNANPLERERRIDVLGFQVDEINKAQLKPSEDIELENQRLILGNTEKIRTVLNSIYENIYSGNASRTSCYDTISTSLKELSGIIAYNSSYQDIYKKFEEVSFFLEDIISEVRKEQENIDFSPESLEEICERIDIIARLKKKYGSSIDDIISYSAKIQQELDDIINSEEVIQKLNQELAQLDTILYEKAKLIHNQRLLCASLLESNISKELSELEIKNATFKVSVEFDDSFKNDVRPYTKNGLSKVEFLISTNAGEPVKPLAKIASGGEMSRIMLAIKTILAKVDKMPSMIFDEIDTGISGRAAQKVGIKLAFLSRNHQIICITHLPQIACMADSHHLIEKNTVNGHTFTNVLKLKDNAIVSEIARIIGGENISETTLLHSKEMLENAREIRKNFNIE